MDIISFNEASTANSRIESFIENPDSTSGIVTVPKVIGSTETITIPAGRVAILPNVQVDGVLNIEGEVFVPSGSSYTGTDIESNNAVFDTLKVQGQNVSPFSGFKNYIINGGFDIWQRGMSQTTSGYGSDDRWNNACAEASQVVSRQLCTDTERALFNANYFSRTVVTRNSSTLDIVYKNQQIEDVTKLANKKVTLSFWAKANSSKNISIQFMQNFGTGGTPSNIVDCGNTIVELTTTWQKKVVTINLPSIVGKTLGTDGSHTSFTRLMIWYDAGSNFNSGISLWQSGTFDIAQVQLEEGSIATPFENRPIGLEFSLCQRYYQTGTGNIQKHSTSGNHSGTQPLAFPCMMRATPTISLTKSGTITGTNALSSGVVINTLYVYGGSDYGSGVVGDYTNFTYTLSAEV